MLEICFARGYRDPSALAFPQDWIVQKVRSLLPLIPRSNDEHETLFFAFDSVTSRRKSRPIICTQFQDVCAKRCLWRNKSFEAVVYLHECSKR